MPVKRYLVCKQKLSDIKSGSKIHEVCAYIGGKMTALDNVSIYVTDTKAQIFIKDDLFIEYNGDDARRWAATCTLATIRRYNRLEAIAVYDSGWQIALLDSDGNLDTYIRLCHPTFPFPEDCVLLRPTGKLRLPNWRHAGNDCWMCGSPNSSEGLCTRTGCANSH